MDEPEVVPAQTRLVSPRWTATGLTAVGWGGQGRFVAREGEDGWARFGPSQEQRVPPLGKGAPHVVYTPRTGELRWGGNGRLLAPADAWGVVESPGGDAVAWCDGHLAKANLFLFTEAKGVVHLGRGAQPAWSPDGSSLVFARPEGDESGKVLASDLYEHRLASGETRRLTKSPARIEMQPAFSPSGDEIAFADWASGEILVAPWPPSGSILDLF